MPVSGRAKLVDIEVKYHYERPLAILVSTDGDRASAVWLPKSVVELNDLEEGETGEITLPEDLAIEKGLV